MSIRIGIGKLAVYRGGGGTSWSSYWTQLISAVVENADPDKIVLTFPTAKEDLTKDDFSVEGMTITDATWVGAVLTLTLDGNIVIFDEDFPITFLRTGQTATVTNNVLDDGNTVGWYDFTDTDTLTLDGSGYISKAANKMGGSGNLFAYAAGTTLPSRGIEGEAIFDGVDDWMVTEDGSIGWIQPAFFYGILKQITWTLNDVIFNGLGSSNQMRINQYDQSPEIALYTGSGSAFTRQNGGLTLDTWSILRVLSHGNASKIQVNDNDALVLDDMSHTAQNPNGMYLGTTYSHNAAFSNIAVKEIILRKSTLQEADINRYLKKKNSMTERIFFTSQGSDYAVVLQTAPSSLCYNNKTYVAYQGYDDDIFITQYDHTTSLFYEAKIAVNPENNGDGHGQPAILIDDLGYIHVFYGCHGNPLKYIKSDNPEDITAWTAQSDVIDSATYSNPFQLSNGDMYIFYRGVSYWSYKKSTDRGQTWGDAVDVISDSMHHYLLPKMFNDKIYMSFIYSTGTLIERYNLYYMVMSSDGVFKDISGNTLTLPKDHEDIDVLVYDSGESYVQSSILGVDAGGNPFILFAEGTDETGDYSIKIAKYGEAWSIIDTGAVTKNWRNFPSAIDVRSSTEIDLYLVIGVDGNVGGAIEKWTSVDGGITWTNVGVVLEGRYVDPCMVLGYNNNARLVAFEYKGEGAWNNKGYLYGDNGILTGTLVL